MIQTIVVPLDESRAGEQALTVALGLARGGNGHVHIVEASPAPADVSGGFPYAHAVREPARCRGTGRETTGPAGVPIRVERRAGPLAPALAAHAVRADADLIIVAGAGRGPAGACGTCGVAQELTTLTSMPLLLLWPSARPPAAPGFVGFRRILIPLDGSSLAERALDAALDFDGADRTFTLVRVVAPETGAQDGIRALPAAGDRTHAEAERARAYLGEVAERLEGEGRVVETAIVVDPDPARALLEYAAAHAVELIALATHGRHGWPRAPLGGVATKVLWNGAIPVLLYRPLPFDPKRPVPGATGVVRSVRGRALDRPARRLPARRPLATADGAGVEDRPGVSFPTPTAGAV